MDNTQILEPAFRIVAEPSRAAGAFSRPGAMRKGMSAPAAFSAFAKKMALGLLDRMNLCRGPRILSAQCLAEELPGASRQPS